MGDNIRAKNEKKMGAKLDGTRIYGVTFSTKCKILTRKS